MTQSLNFKREHNSRIVINYNNFILVNLKLA